MIRIFAWHSTLLLISHSFRTHKFNERSDLHSTELSSKEFRIPEFWSFELSNLLNVSLDGSTFDYWNRSLGLVPRKRIISMGLTYLLVQGETVGQRRWDASVRQEVALGFRPRFNCILFVTSCASARPIASQEKLCRRTIESWEASNRNQTGRFSKACGSHSLLDIHYTQVQEEGPATEEDMGKTLRHFAVHEHWSR